MSGLRRLARAAALRIGPIRHLLDEHNRLAAENTRLRAVPPAPLRPLSGVIDPGHYLDPDWIALHHDLERYSIDKHCFRNRSGEVYRKGWEWTQCLYGLRALGAIVPEARGLGVGAGREAPIFWLADHVAEVVASDLYDGEVWGADGGRETDQALLAAARAACPGSVDHARIRFDNEDGTRLSYPDDRFDFAWSLSSIEHFGGHAAAGEAMRELARVVRPGGVVAVATDLLMLEEQSHPECFTRRELRQWIVHATPRLEPVEPIVFDTLAPEYLVDQIVVPAGVDRRRRHVVLNDGRVQWTSVLLFFRVRAGPG